MAHDTWTRAILYNLSYVITERKKERLAMIFNIMYINEYDKKGCQSNLFQSLVQCRKYRAFIDILTIDYDHV